MPLPSRGLVEALGQAVALAVALGLAVPELGLAVRELGLAVPELGLAEGEGQTGVGAYMVGATVPLQYEVAL